MLVVRSLGSFCTFSDAGLIKLYFVFSSSDFCELTFNTNTINGHVRASDDNTEVWYVERDRSYPDHPERFFGNHQLLRCGALTGRRYWEVELTGGVHTSVSYQGISRRGEGNDGWFGGNDQSWCCSMTAACPPCGTIRRGRPSFAPPPPRATESRCLWTVQAALYPSTESPQTR